MTPTELAERLAAPNPPLLLDVRQPDEFAIVSLPGAKLIPLNELPEQLSVRLLGRPVPNPRGESAIGAIFAHHPQLDPHDPRWRFDHAEADAEPTDVLVYWWKDRYQLQPRVAPAPSDAVE